MTADEFLDVFFGEGNRLDRGAVEARPALKAVVSRFDQAQRRPSLLPRLALDSPRVTWYVLAFDDDEFRRVREEVWGFVGPTYARWSGAIADDAIERAVDALTGGHVARFWVEGRAESEALLVPIARLLALWAERPARTADTRRSARAILRDVDLALAAGDGDGARASLADLRARGAISVENARFIEMLALAAQGRWRDIVRHPDFDDACRVKRPWRVTEALLVAAYHTWIGSAEARSDVAAAVAAYNAHADAFRNLLSARGPMRAPAVIKAAALGQAAAPGTPAAPIVIEALDTEADRGWARALLGLSRPASGPTVGARNTFDMGAYEAALRDALAGDDAAELSDVILLSAYEMGTLDAATQATAFWRALDPEQQTAARRRRVVRDALDALESLVGTPDAPAPPTTWLEWLERLGEDPQWTSATAVAWCGALEFDGVGTVDDDAVTQLADAIIGAAEGPAADVLLEGLPALLSWLERHDPPAASASRLYLATLEALALMEGWESAGLEVAAELVARLLQVGTTPTAYGDMLDSIDLIWGRMASRRHADWFADLVELLEFNPGGRDRLLSTFVTGVERLRAYALPEATREGLRLTSNALGAEVSLAAVTAREDADDEVQPIVATGVVGVYTLDPQVGARVRLRLDQAHPGLTIEHCSDKVATERLINLARRADLLVVAIGSAKHAATDAIDANRPPGRATIRHGFRGSTRIVAACEQAIRDGVLSPPTPRARR